MRAVVVKKLERGEPGAGFALVITVTLTALLALVLLSLAGIGRVEIQAEANAHEVAQARRHALFALRLALGQLQRHAGRDAVVTVRADALGPGANPAWTGVSDAGSESPFVWLVNGAEQGSSFADPAVAVAAPTGRNAPTVWLLSRGLAAAERIKVTKSEIRGAVEGSTGLATVGRYAYWVADESQKASLAIRTDGLAPRLESIFPELATEATNDAREKIVVADQMLHLTSIKAAALTANWPHVTACARGVVGASGGEYDIAAGVFNVNSRSSVAWPAVLGAIEPAVDGSTIDAILAAERPFVSVADFVAKVEARLGPEEKGAGERIRDGLRPLLVARGDTFLVRAYGETSDPLAGGMTAKATAWCEAMVQRTPEVIDTPDGPLGRRFVVTYFRWLGPDEI